MHGNLPAFEKMLKDEGPCDQYICLDDLVNYGPWSNECVDLALSLPNSTLLMGNHESAYIAGNYPGSNPLVQAFFNFTIGKFDRISAIGNFIDSYPLGKYVCTHTLNDTYIYPDTNVTLDNNYIIGHSHHQFKYLNNNFTLYNAGSVGQNRKYINAANYLIYDTDTENMQMKYILYDLNLLISKIRSENYPEECLNYYLSKETLTN